MAALFLFVAQVGCSDDPGSGNTDGGDASDSGFVSDGGNGADAGDAGVLDGGPTPIAQVYRVDHLASNGMPAAVTTDSSIVNTWGLAIGSTGPLWIANMGAGVNSFSPDGMPLSSSMMLTKGANPLRPTGIVFNGERSFLRDAVIVATEQGVIEGWAQGGTPAVRIDRSSQGASYTALAIARTASGDRLYAANFAAGVVEVFDGAYNFLSSFTDTSLPGGYSPLNVAVIDGTVFVTFAKKSAGGTVTTGSGAGFVDVFDTAGKFERQAIAGGALNAPFGIAHSPRDFGRFSDVLLVANLGDDRILAFDPVRGDQLGQLEAPGYQAIRIDRLHDLKFGNDGAGGPHNVLFFTAGPNGGANGVLGSITPTN